MGNASKKFIIDIGSNSVRMLAAEVSGTSVNQLAKALESTRLYEGMFKFGGSLTTEAMHRTVKAVEKFRQQAKAMGIDDIRCFATEAVRNAENREEFLELVREHTSLEVDVLTKEREARAAFYGAGFNGRYGIIDIGGASTELAVGSSKNVEYTKSLPMGAVKALEMYPLGDIADELTMEAMLQWISCVIDENLADIGDMARDTVFVGVGGTVTTIAAIKAHMPKYDPAKIQGMILEAQEIEKLKVKLAGTTLAQRRKMIGMPAERADILLGGVIILLSLMKRLGLSELRASDSDNLEGYIKMTSAGL
jgi:exopolyphosphatase/guanosine-5'-triphosphate,3'-diphosphate pyrophosphatase